MRPFASAPAPAPWCLAKRPMAVRPPRMLGCDWRCSECWPALPLIKHRGFASTTVPLRIIQGSRTTSAPHIVPLPVKSVLLQYRTTVNNCSTFNGPVAAGTAGTADWGLVRQSDDHPPSLCLLSMGSLPERTSPRIPASWGWSLAGFCQLVKFGQVWTMAT